MPQYSYIAKKGPEDTVSGQMEAENERAAANRLRDMGYFPVEVKAAREKRQNVLTMKIGRIRKGDVTVFFQQLSRLMRAGLPLMRSLNTLKQQTDNPKLQDVIEKLYAGVQQGRTFAECLGDHPKVFPVMYSSMVSAGETGGMLEEVLERLAMFSDKEQQLRGKVISSMVYPCFLVVAGTVAVFILLSFVFPKFIELFDAFDAELPKPTLLLMAICDFMEHFWPLILVGLAAAAVALVQFRRSATGRMKIDTTLLRVPLFGTLIQRAEIAKFARTLGTLVDNGVPILNAIRVTGTTLTNRAIAKQMDVIHAAVTDGASLHESLQRADHFTPMAINMMAVGEESGMLGDVARQVADTYDVEVDRAVKNLTTMLEPMLILVMGAFVGFLVIAMMLPLFQISTLVK
jgi:type IV pilus assembly protein PilC